jgi:serine/threonine protein kinase
MTAITIGSRVGPYVITDELGEGGMGVVYRATHTLLNRPAAIKVLRPELGGHSLVLDRFLNEARATTAIRHPGIVEVYDYGHTESGSAYIAMELLEGVTLGARLAARGTLPLHEALMVARRIAAPLAVAHEVGIVHRDLKPDNVFLIRDREGGAYEQVKLLDFGIAKLESATNRTTIGVVLGTPAYMAPEQCRGIPDCDHRVDLYALGCILYELLGGAPPFGRSGTMTDLMAAHLNAPVPRLPLAAVDHQIGRLISRLLAKSPDDRPRSAVEVVFEIDRHLAMVAPPPPGPRNTLRLAVATATGLALTLTSIGAWYRWRRTPRADTALGVAPPVLGSVVRPPIDAAPTAPPVDAATVGTAATIALDASPASTVVITRARVKKPVDTSEVTVELGSGGDTADVNTTVSP